MSINSNMKEYGYALLGQLDDYGEPIIPTEPTGVIRMAISLRNQMTTDNILYSSASFIGLTKENITDKYFIFNGKDTYKVLYVNDYGRYKQAYMERM